MASSFMLKLMDSSQMFDAIIDLYLDVKIRNEADVLRLVIQIESVDKNALLEEKAKLKKLDPKLILEYIKTSIEILVKINVEKKIEEFKLALKKNEIEEQFTDEEVNVYEKALRQLESEVRNHIKVILSNK